MLSSLVLVTASLLPGQCSGGVCHAPVRSVLVRPAVRVVRIVERRPVRRLLARRPLLRRFCRR